jgi:UDP-3-O-[3-hydroxymyristoyl] glucosamine N-acyltransferase
MESTLATIVSTFGGELHGDPRICVSRIVPLDKACEGDLSFLANPKYRGQLSATKASAVIVAAYSDECPVAAIVTPNPYLYFARVAQWFSPEPIVRPGIHPSAVIEGDVSPSAQVGAQSYIARGARVLAGAVIGPNCTILDDASVGEGTRLRANVTVYESCEIGQRCLIHAGAVIGSDGFGFARDADGGWVKIPQTGRVIIGDDVEIGACTSIDRGALSDTIIGNGVKLDNQIQIAHNVTIGEHTAMAGCVGVAGSTQIGSRCTVGGAAMILGHLSLADGVNVSSGTLIGKSILRPGSYSGAVPFLEHTRWLKNFSHIRHLDDVSEKIRRIDERLDLMEKKK